MSDPLISVLLPCRNGGRTLGVAIQSVLSQTFGDFELLLLNDGSTDNSLEIASSFGDPRIRIVGGREQRGLATRLNEGLALSRGIFVARMDADDICFPTRFEKQVACLLSNPDIDLLGCRAVVFRDSGQAIGLLPFEPTHERLCARPWRNIPLPHPTWMGRAEWFRQHGYRIPEVIRAEDQELLLRASPGSRYACLPDVLLAYRQGTFQLKRTLVARRHLLEAQIGIFLKWRSWRNVALAIFITSAKVAVDCLCALPGMQGLFFARMDEPVDSDTGAELANCLTRYTAHSQ